MSERPEKPQKKDIDSIINDFLSSIESEDEIVREFGMNFKPHAEAIFRSLPQNKEKDRYVAGEIMEAVDSSEKGQVFFPERIYHIGPKDAFLSRFFEITEELGQEAVERGRKEAKQWIEDHFGKLFQYDSPHVYEEIQESLDDYFLDKARKNGRMSSFAQPKNSIIIGDDDSNLQNAFLIRISNSNRVGELFIVPKDVIVADPEKAAARLLATIREAYPEKKALSFKGLLQKLFS